MRSTTHPESPSNIRLAIRRGIVQNLGSSPPIINLGDRAHIVACVPSTMNSRNGADTFAERNSPNIVYTHNLQSRESRSVGPEVGTHTIDKTIIGSTGRGVAYTSPGACSALGIAGRSGACVTPLSSSPSPPRLHRLSMLGLRTSPEKDTRLLGRRALCGPLLGVSCASESISRAESPGPNTRLGGIPRVDNGQTLNACHLLSGNQEQATQYSSDHRNENKRDEGCTKKWVAVMELSLGTYSDALRH